LLLKSQYSKFCILFYACFSNQLAMSDQFLVSQTYLAAADDRPKVLAAEIT